VELCELQVGVTMMIFQSGMHIHFDKVRQVGRKAFVVAIFGTFLPLLCGMGLVGVLFDGEFFPSGFAAGCAFAPTSIDISIKLLDESKMLNSLAGQTTLTAAFIDDIFALGTLVMMQSLADGDVRVSKVIILVSCSFGFLALGCFLALYVFCHLPLLLARVPPKRYASIQPRDEVHLFIMVGTLCLFAYITSLTNPPHGFIGSHLLGAFVAGMCFVNVPRSHAIWQTQFKRIGRWTVRFFFAASVGFAVPVSDMTDPKVIWKGVLLGIGPCISTKIFSGAFAYMRYATPKARERARQASWATRFAQPQQMLVGMAMVARGEFAYMVAETAHTTIYAKGFPGQRMMDPQVYAATIWALVMATVASPLLFRWALGVYGRATPIVRSKSIGGVDPAMLLQASDTAGKGEGIDVHQGRGFRIRIASRHHVGVQRELLDCLHAADVDVLEAQVHCVNHPSTTEVDAFVASYVVIARGAKKDFDDEKLEEMQHALTETLDDKDSQVIFEPYDDDFSNDGVLEIQVLVQFHPDVLHEMTDALASMHLDVFNADVTHTKQLAHGHTTVDGRGKLTEMETSDAHGHSEPPNRLRAASSSTPNESQKPSRTASRPISRRNSKDDLEVPNDLREEARERVKAAEMGDGVAFYAIEEKERAVFYARETDGTHQFAKARRAQIQAELERIVHEHHLHGTVTMRAVHTNEMSHAHRIPRFDHEERVVLIKCQGTHHPELLHELCDLLHEVELDVLHAEMDTDSRGTEHHALYVARRDNARTNGDERTALRGNIDALYRKHGKKDSVGEAARVSVKPLRGQEEEVMTSLAATALLGSAESPHPLSSRTRSSSPKPGRRGSPAKTSNGSFKAADPTVACCPQQADVTSSSIDVVVQ